MAVVHLVFHETVGDGHCFYRAVYNLLKRVHTTCDISILQNLQCNAANERDGVKSLRRQVGFELITSKRLHRVVAEELRWISAGHILPENNTAMQILYDRYQGVMPNIDQALSDLCEIITITSCWASALEFAIMNRLLMHIGINLVNITKQNAICNKDLVHLLDSHHIKSKHVIFVSTNGVHYMWVSMKLSECQSAAACEIVCVDKAVLRNMLLL